MSPQPSDQRSSGLPEGYVAIPLFPGTTGPLKVCILAQTDKENPAGPLVCLRQNLDARILLGCVTDASGRPKQWVEIWVQTVAGLGSTPAACRETLTNASLDTRWSRFADAVESQDGRTVLRTGWESDHPPPAYVNVQEAETVHPVDAETGASWALCTDDALLAENDLPPYGTTLHRYLHVRPDGDQPPLFAPLTAGAVENAHTVPLERVAGDGDLTALNPEGGLLFLCPFSPLSLDEFLGILSGGSWEGIQHGRELVDPMALVPQLGSPDAPHALFLSARGRSGRLTECLHIKLCLLADMLKLVSGIIRDQQRPFMNLSNDAFRIRLAPGGLGLPGLWTATPALTSSGEAVVLPIETSEARYFLGAGGGSISIYRPTAGGAPVRGRGTVRIRQALTEGRKGVIVEGTLQSPESIPAGAHDLTWLRLNLGGDAIDLYATVTEDSALAAGEWRFRTVGQMLSEKTIADLKSAEGVPLQSVPFEVLPIRSSPCDLFSLAVIAVQTLLVDGGTTLPVALDEIISLAREAGAAGSDAPLPQRIANLFAGDRRWIDSLGPQRLILDEMTPEEAFESVPGSVWWDVLAMIVRMFPAVSADSRCSDYGDAPPGALQDVLAGTLDESSRLVARTRNLIVTDWVANRETRDVIAACLEAVASPDGNGQE
jgi:hypothetical protein